MTRSRYAEMRVNAIDEQMRADPPMHWATVIVTVLVFAAVGVLLAWRG